MVTDPQTNTQTDKGDYNTLHHSFDGAQCKYQQTDVTAFVLCCKYLITFC